MNKFILLLNTLGIVYFVWAVNSSGRLLAYSHNVVLDDPPLLQTTRTDNKRFEHESFSACLLIMDDNFRLPEWLAYHYFALPLRYLVVAVDPNSQTSPSSIFDQWRHKMTIIEWNNFTESIRYSNDTPSTKKFKHRGLQTSFYKSCAQHLKKQHRTWTCFHDVDEFLTISSEGYNTSNAIVQKPGHVLQVLKELRLPTHNVTKFPYSHFQTPSCISIPRALYSAVESTFAQRKENVPSFIDSKRLDTLRYRFRATPRGNRDGLGKSIIDVSKLTLRDLRSGGNAHKPLKIVCQASSSWIPYGSIPLGIHHYLGSWEAYSFRNDARKGHLRNREIWEERSVLQTGGANDEIRYWIQGFVDFVGEKEATFLLKDAGLPFNFSKSAEEEAAWRLQVKDDDDA